MARGQLFSFHEASCQQCDADYRRRRHARATVRPRCSSYARAGVEAKDEHRPESAVSRLPFDVDQWPRWREALFCIWCLQDLRGIFPASVSSAAYLPRRRSTTTLPPGALTGSLMDSSSGRPRSQRSALKGSLMDCGAQRPIRRADGRRDAMRLVRSNCLTALLRLTRS